MPTRAERDRVEALVLDAEILKLGDAMTSPVEGQTGRGPGDALIRSEGFRRHFVDGEPLAVRWTLGTFEYLGAAGDAVLESTGSNADAVYPQLLDELHAPGLQQETPSLAGLFSQAQATSATIKYMKVTTRNAPADAVTVESQQKPGAEFAFDDATVTLEKLAAFIPISEEMMEDSPQIAKYINQQLPFMVAQAEDKKFAAEIYAAATGIGLSTTIGGLDASGFDSIADAIKDVQVAANMDPDAIFIHPLDFWSIVVKKSSTAGDYYSGSPFAANPRTLWGLPVVVSTRAPSGFPLVGNFKQGGTVFRKGGIRLEMSNSHESYFRENLIAVRAEVRTALAVTLPECFAVANLAS